MKVESYATVSHAEWADLFHALAVEADVDVVEGLDEAAEFGDDLVQAVF